MGKIRLLAIEHSINLLQSAHRRLADAGVTLPSLYFPPLSPSEERHLLRHLREGHTLPQVATHLNIHVHRLIHHIDTQTLPGQGIARFAYQHATTLQDAEWRLYRRSLRTITREEV